MASERASVARSSLPWEPVATCGCCGSDQSTSIGSVAGVTLLRCRGCGTRRFAAVVPFEAVYEGGYHSGEGDFGWDFERERPYQRVLADEALTWIERHQPKGSLVDVGGGMGYFAAAAQARGWSATLLEPVADACRFAEQEWGLPTICTGAEEMVASGRCFDLIAMSHTLEHLREPLTVLQQLREAVEPGGAVFIELPNNNSAARRLQRGRWLGWQPGEHIHHFTMGTLTGLARRAGYEVIDSTTVVPGWGGLIPDVYAHWLGLGTALDALVRRSHRRRGGGAERPDHGDPSDDIGREGLPPTVDESTGLRGLVFGTGLRAVERIEESVGWGTNLRILIRPQR